MDAVNQTAGGVALGAGILLLIIAYIAVNTWRKSKGVERRYKQMMKNAPKAGKPDPSEIKRIYSFKQPDGRLVKMDLTERIYQDG